MKVLHVGQLIGGLDVYIRNVITYSDSDFEFVIVHGEGDKSNPVTKEGVPVKEYKISMHRELNPLKDLKGLVQTIRIVRKEKPDVIHCHSAKGGVIGRVAGFLTGTRTFYTPHAFSYLSARSRTGRCIYLMIERATRLNACLLACSESERRMGIERVHYRRDRAFIWHNAVPDALTGLDKDEE